MEKLMARITPVGEEADPEEEFEELSFGVQRAVRRMGTSAHRLRSQMANAAQVKAPHTASPSQCHQRVLQPSESVPLIGTIRLQNSAISQ